VRRPSRRERDPFLGDLGEVAVRAIRPLERLLEPLPAEAEQVDVAIRGAREGTLALPLLRTYLEERTR